MARRRKFASTFAPEAIDHLNTIERKYHRLLRQAIDEQLTYTPAAQTRNRKPLEQPAPFGATWELRCGPDNRLRIFYDVDSEARTVSVFNWRRGVSVMTIAPLADVKARLSAYLEQCEAEGPIVITRHGKAVAVLLAPYDDDDLERLVLGRSRRFQALLNKSRQSIKQGKGLSAHAFWNAVQQRSRKQKAGQATRRRATKR